MNSIRSIGRWLRSVFAAHIDAADVLTRGLCLIDAHLVILLVVEYAGRRSDDVGVEDDLRLAFGFDVAEDADDVAGQSDVLVGAEDELQSCRFAGRYHIDVVFVHLNGRHGGLDVGDDEYAVADVPHLIHHREVVAENGCRVVADGVHDLDGRRSDRLAARRERRRTHHQHRDGHDSHGKPFDEPGDER